MGLNLNLAKMLGVATASACPRCHKTFNNYFDDYDIEAGSPNTGTGEWKLSNYCPYCEHEWIEHIKLYHTQTPEVA